MTTRQLVFNFALLLAAAIQLPAQPTNADPKNLGEIRALAESGDATNQFVLGRMYDNGKGLAKDRAEALRWYLKSAAQGYAEAQCRVGLLYAVGGKPVEKDEAKAVEWYRKAADQGLAKAQSHLGMCYTWGTGVPQDYEESIKWLRKAAEQGSLRDQTWLALLLTFGGLSGECDKVKNPSEAAKWYLRAARQGDGGSQINIGWMYVEGEGVIQDFVEAYKWFNIAAASSENRFRHEDKPDLSTATPELREAYEEARRPIAARAREARDSLAQQMTAEQIAQAQALARDFKPRKESGSDNSGLRGGLITSSPTASGTGFLLTEDGFLITNEHVVKDSTQVRLVTAVGLIVAKVVKVDAANDLALLRAEGRFKPLPVAASRTVRLGNTVATVGFPNIGLQGFTPKLARGEIAGLSGAKDDPRYFQISVPVQPGNSGGALVDERGNVVGVVCAKLSARAALATSGALPENVNYAVKSSLLLSFLESVPEVSARLKDVNTKERKFEDVVKSVEQAAVLVLVY